ncbi:hypothetical protein VTN77DRAFT_1366 [Rasamsonia byssochlamydoides]|uniref:uncharacterized protein n=1 Tax=Rasamsonia byssochlamydoides TaxID=89139 RepID=UPI003741FE48
MTSPKKRSWEGHLISNSNTTTPQPEQEQDNSTAMADTDNTTAIAAADSSNSSSAAILSIFETFRSELDEHHDRRERIVKASRDITALSKKIIFSMQRLRTVNAPIPPSIAKENQARFDQILDLFRSIVPDITGLNAWRYQRQVSPGIQEFIEALSFQHYVQTQRLISRDEVAAHLPPEVLVTEEDYLMGIFDLTGEMMRFAVTMLSTGGQVKRKTQPSSSSAVASTDGNAEQEEDTPLRELPAAQANIVVDLRGMRAQFESLNVPRRHSSNMMRDMYKKVEVMQNSVEKVERAAYGILVRGSERPSGWTPDLSTSPVEVESY